MPRWEYRKLDLNELPRNTDAIDLLNDAGQEGWELAHVTANNIAFLKHQIDEPAPTKTARRNPQVQRKRSERLRVRVPKDSGPLRRPAARPAASGDCRRNTRDSHYEFRQQSDGLQSVPTSWFPTKSAPAATQVRCPARECALG